VIERGPATANDVVLAFVRAEIDSSRFGECYRSVLASRRLSRAELIEEADVTNIAHNAARAQLLQACRGYPNQALFNGFPPDIKWRRVEIEHTELHRLQYANYPDWTALSGGTRRVVDAVAKIDSSSDAKRVDPIKGIAARLRAGHRFPELIAVEQAPQNLVLVEGHARATAYAAVRPSWNLEFFLGSSAKLVNWVFYPKDPQRAAGA
jgi:hypothetical protein